MYHFLDIAIPVDSRFNKIVFFFIVRPSKIDISLLLIIGTQYFAAFFLCLFKGINHELVYFFTQFIL
jgi:hypothetical protein